MGNQNKTIVSLLVLFSLTSLVLLPNGTVKAETRTLIVPDQYSTIQSAIDHANNGDTVFVKKGYYPETLVVNKSISVIGEDRELTVIDGQRKITQITLLQADNIVFSNFTLGNSGVQYPRNSGSSVVGGIGIAISRSQAIVYSNVYPYPQNITVTNTTIISCPIVGIDIGLSFYDNISSNLIIGKPDQSSIYSQLYGLGAGISVYCVNSTIENNQFYNLSTGISFATKYLVLNPQTFDLEKSNTIQGNNNVTLETIPTPFPPISPIPTQTIPVPTPSPSINGNPPHLDPIYYLIPVSVIVAIVMLSVLLYRRHRKTRTSVRPF